MAPDGNSIISLVEVDASRLPLILVTVSLSPSGSLSFSITQPVDFSSSDMGVPVSSYSGLMVHINDQIIEGFVCIERNERCEIVDRQNKLITGDT